MAGLMRTLFLLALMLSCGPAMVTDYVRPMERQEWVVECSRRHPENPSADFRRCADGWPGDACPSGYDVVAHQQEVWCRRQREAQP